jgi:hypothetical protein
MKDYKVEIARFYWTGPFSLENAISFEEKYDIYQIYVASPIYGLNALVYIGKTRRVGGSRLLEHEGNWLHYESDVSIRFGKLYGSDAADDDERDRLVGDAETLGIFRHQPSGNSNQLQRLSILNPLIIMNYGQIGMLMREYSSLLVRPAEWDE